ncbi:Transcription factor KUA1-like protein [Drosera capensis]
MTRRCSHCSHNGHNSRTCPNRGVKLFGVRLTDGGIRKCASMGNLSHYNGSGSSSGLMGLGMMVQAAAGSTTPGSDGGGDTPDQGHGGGVDGYASEDVVAGSSTSRERKKGTLSAVAKSLFQPATALDKFYAEKDFEVSCIVQGVPWMEEEHRMFLLGLQKLGKGDWRGISRNFVISRTPTQVASHAQKYFIRQSNASRRKRRSSLFDIVAEETMDAPMVSHDFFPMNPEQDTQNDEPLPVPGSVDEECESMASSNSNEGEATLPKTETSQGSFTVDDSPNCYPIVYPTYVAPFFPFAIPFWAGYNTTPQETAKETHEVLKPTAVHSTSPINVDDLVGMSKLSLGESIGGGEGSSLSLKLLDGSSRQSAFHSKPSAGSSEMNSSSDPMQAV